MKNKILVLIIIVLIPICYLVVKQSNNNFSLKNETQPDIIVKLDYNNQEQELNLNNYLIGVVGAEMPATFNLEALKAQAVASRTFAVFNIKDNVISTNTKEQAYQSNEELQTKWQDKYDEYYAKITDAVTSTNNIVIKYNNVPIKAYYYAMSNGYTESSITVFSEDLPYIDVVPSEFDEQVNNYLVTKSMSQADFCTALNIPNQSINISNIIKDSSNRVVSININNNEYSGTTIRKLLNLRSTDFTIEINNNEINITTKGYGHGVGMSQYGANYLANNNYTYQDILNYYYKNVEITNY
jgi:stage II sporulation protein D